jgi:hemoglobin-like flavoprotein
MRDRIFVSYSHDDAAWLEMLKKKLGTGIYAKTFQMWSDEELRPAANWRQDIEAAIASSRIALLLVSRNFLRSDFIVEAELPSILRRHQLTRPGQPEGLSIWWVPLERISNEELQSIHLDEIQAAVATPGRPLSALDEKERSSALDDLSAMLMKELGGLLTDTSRAARDQFKVDVEAALGSTNTKLGEAFAPGDYSIIYRAQRLGAELAVKALVHAPRREWLAQDFINRAESVRNVTNATAIGISAVVDRDVKCVVMEFVGAPTLKVRLRQEGPLPSGQAADILAQLAGVAADLHRLDGQPIIGPIRPSHVHYDQVTKKVRISLVHIANETLKSCRQRPTLLLDPDALTYLSPQRYLGQKIDASADQYYLGLLALELLQGKPPVEVSAFADLEKKRRFFASPRDFFSDLPTRQPAFSFVLSRMLEQDPLNRWASMSDLAEALRQVAAGGIPKAVKMHANADYNGRLRDNRVFFESFYRALFESSAEIRGIFTRRGVTMDEQYRKLDGAVGSLFSFDPGMQPTTLDAHAERHRELGLTAQHFELFRAAFLAALRETNTADAYSQDAWHAILDPALAFMTDKTCHQVGVIEDQGGAQCTGPRKRVTRAVKRGAPAAAAVAPSDRRPGRRPGVST